MKILALPSNLNVHFLPFFSLYHTNKTFVVSKKDPSNVENKLQCYKKKTDSGLIPYICADEGTNTDGRTRMGIVRIEKLLAQKSRQRKTLSGVETSRCEHLVVSSTTSMTVTVVGALLGWRDSLSSGGGDGDSFFDPEDLVGILARSPEGS